MSGKKHSAAASLDRNKMADSNEAVRTGDTPVELEDMLSPPPAPLPIEDDLMGLARLGELRAIQKLFDSGKYTASSTDAQGITALHVGPSRTRQEQKDQS